MNQKAILAHPAVKMFVTHGGLSSLHESIYYGKPMLVIPLFGDQFLNAISIEDAGLGIWLNDENFNASQLADLIVKQVDQALQKPTRDNLPGRVKKFQKIAQLNSESHLLVVANAIELAATEGVDHLIPADVNLKTWPMEWIEAVLVVTGSLYFYKSGH